MKPTISKSAVMKRAWKIFKGNNPFSYSFSACLRRAWFVEKGTIAYEEKKTCEAVDRAATENRQDSFDNSFMAGCAAQYTNARPGQYFGD